MYHQEDPCRYRPSPGHLRRLQRWTQGGNDPKNTVPPHTRAAAEGNPSLVLRTACPVNSLATGREAICEVSMIGSWAV